jgi:hypothetical protein
MDLEAVPHADRSIEDVLHHIRRLRRSTLSKLRADVIRI